MTLITFSADKVVMVGDKVGTEAACCCGGAAGQCCGIPKNCTVTVSTDTDYVYDQSTNSWKDANNDQLTVEFGNCRYVGGGDLGEPYVTCCISFIEGATPGGACILFSAYLVGRVVCDSCCEAEPEYEGDTNQYGVNCRLEGVTKQFNQVGDCDAFKALVNFDNWDITMTCDPAPDPCNPFP